MGKDADAACVEQQLNSLGDNFVWIEAGGRAVNGVRTGTHVTKTLVMADAVAIKNQVSLIKSVSPNLNDPGQVVYGTDYPFDMAAGPLADQLAGTGLSAADTELIAGRNAATLFGLALPEPRSS